MRERILPLLVVTLYLAYFLLFITGGPRAHSYYQGPEGSPVSEEEAYAALEGDDPTAELDSLQSQRVHEVRMQPGLLAQMVLLGRADTLMEDPLLESDARPERLVRHLERSRTGVLFGLVLSLFWCMALGLSLLALVRNHWFATAMVRYTLTPSMLFLFGYLLFIQRERLSLMDGNPYLLTGVSLEVALFFLGALALIRTAMPAAREAPADERFMNHHLMQGDPVARLIGGFVQAALQIAVIGLVGLGVSNLFLLPVFSLQLNFPQLYTLLIVIGVLSLIAFYTLAYVRVSRADGYRPDALSGTAFLGFRIQKNTLFLISVIVLVVALLGAIVAASYVNIGLLETFNLLERPAKL